MPARAYASRLLAALGVPGAVGPAPDPAQDWAASGGMWLTGRADGPPLLATGASTAARGVLLALQSLSSAALPDVRVLGERAALRGFTRHGGVSCGGATRLLATSDGHVALTLARPDDLELVPALVGADVDPGWEPVTEWAAVHPTVEVRDRAVLLGLAAAVLNETPADEVPWRVLATHPGEPLTRTPRVVDLSSLWAGPLCASLLGMLGCEVIKVEDPRRPDGARRGDPAFFDLLNAGARCVSVDLRSSAFTDLLATADVVIEGSRPRALQQLGIDAAAFAASGTVWVSITGHGRDQPTRLGYGDDTAVAGGLVCHDDQGPVFVADAVADPLTGLHAALVAWASLQTGGGRLVDVALARVAATASSLSGPAANASPLAAARPWARS